MKTFLLKSDLGISFWRETMSIAGCVAAESVANEILELLQQLEKEHEDNETVVSVLKQVEAKAESIRITAAAGWY